MMTPSEVREIHEARARLRPLADAALARLTLLGADEDTCPQRELMTTAAAELHSAARQMEAIAERLDQAMAE